MSEPNRNGFPYRLESWHVVVIICVAMLMLVAHSCRSADAQTVGYYAGQWVDGWYVEAVENIPAPWQPPAGYAGWQCVVSDMPVEQRVRFRNPDGSCVQCSIGMLGVDANVPQAEFLLWQSPYGPAVRGGSGPSRVKSYCDSRNIPAWNVTGEESQAWVEWALLTGRRAAIQWGSNHMVTALGITTDRRQIAICDNNSPARVTWYAREEFVRRHYPWAVILRTPPAPGNPTWVKWW